MTTPAGHSASDMTLEEIGAAGRELWQSVPPGGVIWLTGELGAGKTTLVKAVVRAAGAGDARSPTFALIHEYGSPEGPVVHVDCYRLRHPDEAIDLDLAQLARRSRLTLIEWPERAGSHAPLPAARVHLSHTRQGDRRRLEIQR